MFLRMVLDFGKALAERAKPLHLELVPEDPVVHGAARLLLEARVDGHGKVVDPPAAEAADVIVPPGVAVEARRMASSMDLADDSQLRQPLEVAVDGAEADTRETAARLAVDPGCGGMVHGGPDHVEDQLSLPRLPAQHRQ